MSNKKESLKPIRIIESCDKKLFREKLQRIGDFEVLGFSTTTLYGADTIKYTALIELKGNEDGQTIC